ncbi:MAG: sugar ABC transporter permease [Chloroflexi bacterium]|nr:sugar ABC transporter permease [Chloroflexota bacterium]MCL5946577.1 sugar ABC transporter permease [Chloroflexota bacterium]
MARISVLSRPAVRTRSLQRQRIIWFYLFILPWILGFLIFTLYPVVASFYFSFTNYSVLQPPSWAGLHNYAHLLRDQLFWHSLAITGIYAVVSVPLNLALAFCCALLLNLRLPLMRIFRTIYYLPTVLPVAATSVLWMFLFLPEFGIIDWFIRSITGLKGPDWLGNPQWVLPALVIMSVWGIGGAMVIFLAGLQAIPGELYEAAQIDGANAFRRALSITVPMVSPVVLLNLILGLIGASQTFVQPYILTQGGPNYASYFYNLYLYQNAFDYFKMGLASAQAWILFAIVLISTVLVFRSSARWVYYGGELS